MYAIKNLIWLVIRSWVTCIVTAAIVISCMMPYVCSSPVSQVEQTAETKDSGDCLPNQFLSPNLTCENCTFCPQGTEHSSNEQCGNGLGVKTTCTPCAESFFQVKEGYTDLVCNPCVTCYPNVKFMYLQKCTPTQNTKCGPCPPGMYSYYPNVCLKCREKPSHADCSQPTPGPIKTSASTNQSTTSMYTTPSALSSLVHNTSNDSDEAGSPTKKFTLLGIFSAIIVRVIV